MKQNKLKLLVMAAIAVAAGGYCGVESFNNDRNGFDSLLLMNVEALTDGDDDSELEKERKRNCYISGIAWNMASVCVDSGFETTTCTITGEVSLFGVTVKGSYSKGQVTRVPWARYSCQTSNGNCCMQQGLYSVSTKLA